MSQNQAPKSDAAAPMGSDLPLYARVRATSPITTEDGTPVPPDREGTVVCHISSTHVLVEFSFPDRRYAGGCRFENATVFVKGLELVQAEERRSYPRRGARK